MSLQNKLIVEQTLYHLSACGMAVPGFAPLLPGLVVVESLVCLLVLHSVLGVHEVEWILHPILEIVRVPWSIFSSLLVS